MVLINQDLFAIHDVETLLGGLTAQLAAAEVEPFSLAFGEGWGEAPDAINDCIFNIHMLVADQCPLFGCLCSKNNSLVAVSHIDGGRCVGEGESTIGGCLDELFRSNIVEVAVASSPLKL